MTKYIIIITTILTHPSVNVVALSLISSSAANREIVTVATIFYICFIYLYNCVFFILLMLLINGSFCLYF